ncbi:MAG: hypothetical protein MI924_36220, partial [Chloroflexales bacterium]|nr:hypothetical protein [Chloroflexales bacterium]
PFACVQGDMMHRIKPDLILRGGWGREAKFPRKLFSPSLRRRAKGFLEGLPPAKPPCRPVTA